MKSGRPVGTKVPIFRSDHRTNWGEGPGEGGGEGEGEERDVTVGRRRLAAAPGRDVPTASRRNRFRPPETFGVNDQLVRVLNEGRWGRGPGRLEMLLQK